VPLGVTEEEVAAQGQASSRASLAVGICQLLFQLGIKGSLDKIFNFFYYLQLTKGVLIY